MARTNDNWCFTYEAEKAILLMPIPQTSVCQPAATQNSEFDQWWEDKKKWYEMTDRIERGEIPLSVEQQYKQELVRELHAEIQELAVLEEDWNEEGAPVIDRGSIQQAHLFLKQLACEASDTNGEWDLPSVYPTVDGGVQLYWNKADSQIALTFRPQERGIDYLMKKRGEPAQRRSLLIQDAVAEALRAIRGA